MIQNASKKDIVLISTTAGFLFSSFFTLIFFWQQVYLLTVILFFFALIELFVVRSKKLILIFVISGIGGTVIEIISIYFGIWAYSVKSLWNIPFWLFPLWGNAGIIIVAIYKLLSKIGWFERIDK